jgi:hypothetical protein
MAATPTDPTTGQMAIGDLIRVTGRANGWTDANLEERSGVIAKWWVQRRNNNPPIRNFADVPLTPKIAAGLGIYIQDVILAYGYHFYKDHPLWRPGGDRTPLLMSLLPAGLELLPDSIAYDRAGMLRQDVATARHIAALEAELEQARKPPPRKK